MAILAECPICHNKQSAKNKRCKCGEDLDKAKKSKRVKYWIQFRLPDGRQRKEFVSYSINEAKDADGKRRSQKRENRIFDMLPESKITFSELSEWYEGLKSRQRLASFDRIQLSLKNFNEVFGDFSVNSIGLTDLENYQEERADKGKAAATIYQELSHVKTMVTRAFYDNKINGRALKAFNRVKRKLKKGANARKQIITIGEYLQLMQSAEMHLKAFIEIAFNTGMRKGEIRLLKWSYLDFENGFIRLPAEIPKEGKDKNIPMNHHVKKVLLSQPRALHHDYVMQYRGKPIVSRDGLKKSFAASCKEAGIPCGQKTKGGIIFHDIRRTVKTNMLAAGVDKAYRDKILGHSPQDMDLHYIQPDEDTLKAAMRKYTEWFDGEIERCKKELKKRVG